MFQYSSKFPQPIGILQIPTNLLRHAVTVRLYCSTSSHLTTLKLYIVYVQYLRNNVDSGKILYRVIKEPSDIVTPSYSSTEYVNLVCKVL